MIPLISNLLRDDRLVFELLPMTCPRLHVLAGLFVALVPSKALAADRDRSDESRPTTAWLDWTVGEPKGCATQAQLVEAAEALVGRRLFVSKGQSEVVLRGSVGRTADRTGWRARVTLFAADGTNLGIRELTSPEADCSALDGPLALVLALMVDGAAKEVTVHLPAVQAPSKPGWRTVSSVGMTVSSGLLPGLALGPQLTLGVQPPKWPMLRVGLTVWPASNRQENGRGGRFTAWEAGAHVCPELARRSLGAVSVCVGGEAGTMHGAGEGLDVTLEPMRPLISGEALLLGYFPLGGPFWLQLGGGAAVPLTRPRFTYELPDRTTAQVHSVGAVIPVGNLAFSVRLPP